MLCGKARVYLGFHEDKYIVCTQPISTIRNKHEGDLL